MAKRAVILHGTEGKPESNWFMWLKAKLETEGYDVWVPQLPNCDKPNRNTYGDFLFSSGWDFTDNVIIGHSSGAVEVLNLCMDDRLPHIKLGVMVGAWAGGMPKGYDDPTTFANLFSPDGFDFPKIKSHADIFIFMHGSDDPYCPPEQANYLADQLRAPITFVENGHHLGAKFSELPELWGQIEVMLAYQSITERYGEELKNLANR